MRQPLSTLYLLPQTPLREKSDINSVRGKIIKVQANYKKLMFIPE